MGQDVVMGSDSDVIRVFLVDDHEVVRRGVRDLLDMDDGLEVVGEAGNVEEAMRRVGPADPDVAVLDVRLPDGNGVELCRDLRSQNPDLRCVILTSFGDDEALFDAIMAGASAYVLKQVRGSDLVDAVRRVGQGQSLLDPALTARVLERIRVGQTDSEEQKLSPQERKILELLGEGLSNKEIAARIHLAEKTVRNYVSNLLSKLGMHRRTEAAAYAARLDERRRGRSSD
jgi:DNA-binding NarL/FixJ family response regulator